MLKTKKAGNAILGNPDLQISRETKISDKKYLTIITRKS